MPRLARIAVVNVAHHVTQRGNARQFILANDDERKVYLSLLRKYVELCELSLLGYCLMSNHVHLLVVPRKDDSLARALKQTHGRYAWYWNATHRSSGHVWQGRFYSCPLDESHLWTALRYVELNPVRAAMVSQPELWPWSSAAVHCVPPEEPMGLELSAWNRRWSRESWKEYLATGEAQWEIAAIRQCTHSGRPLGAESFIRSLEEATQRHLRPQTGGRPKTVAEDRRQATLDF
ncbi:MAG TPA: transposase [Candidatus Acidoferrales bacterium]|nr:transposase [Candidatus Acidoferrales bacterium]